MRLAVGHDPGGERRSDPRQAVQFAHAGDVQIDEATLSRSGGRRGVRPPRSARSARAGLGESGARGSGPAGVGREGVGHSSAGLRSVRLASAGLTARSSSGDGRVDGGQLSRQRHPIALHGALRTERPAPSHPDSERRYRSDEQQGLAFGGSRHSGSVADPSQRPAPESRGRGRTRARIWMFTERHQTQLCRYSES